MKNLTDQVRKLRRALIDIALNAPESLPEDNRGCGNEDDAYTSGSEREHFRLATIAKKALQDEP